MSFKRFWLGLVLCLATNGALAQDHIKTEPTHYRLAFENDHTQVVYIHYGVREKSRMHEHPGGVVVNVTGGHLRFTDPSGKVTEVYAKPGEARWFPPFKHKVENLGDEPYSAVYVGFKGKLSAAPAGAKDPAHPIDEQTAKVLAGSLAKP